MKRAAAASALLGMLFAASFAPWHHWGLNLAVLTGWMTLLAYRQAQGDGLARLTTLAFAFSLGWFGAGLAWLFNSMHVYGGMHPVLAVLAVLVFAAYLSVFPALATLLALALAGLGPRRSGSGAARGSPGSGSASSASVLRWGALLAAAWTAGEIARGLVFTGFPWLAIGYGQIDGPLDVLAPLLGVHGVGLATLAVAGLVAAGLTTGRLVLPGLALALVAGLLWVPQPSWTQPSGPPLDVRLLQGNVEQEMKFRPERMLSAMRSYVEMIEASRETLIILPETAWTVPWSSTPESLAQRVLTRVQSGQTVAIGMPLRAPSADDVLTLSNSVLSFKLDPRAEGGIATHRYDKHHLVPFGEFVPPGFRWFVDLMEIPLGDFSRGARRQVPLEVGGQRVAFNICYEDLFGEEIIQALRGPFPATILANVSNIAWFGDSHALTQHLNISRMRSLETGRPMLRATNTGVTAAIDARGQVIGQLPPYQAGGLSVLVQGTEGLTPYARWGGTPLVILTLVIAALALLAPRIAGRRSARPRSARPRAGGPAQGTSQGAVQGKARGAARARRQR